MTSGAQAEPGNGKADVRAPRRDAAIVLAKDPAGNNDNGAAFPKNDGSESARGIEQSIAYMREHLDQSLQVAKLAAVANVSSSYFFVLFKRCTGSPPMDYFTHLRMEHARRLLDATPARVKEVAAALGYEDPFHFSRVFKAVNRVPPSWYRAMQRQPSPVLGPDKIGTAEDGRCANANGAAFVSLPGKNAMNQKSRIVHSL